MRRSSSTYLRRNQIVFAYEPEGWPAGVLTGYEQDGGFVLEYVFSVSGAPQGALIQTLALGLQTAWELEYRFVALAIHANHPQAGRLEQLAKQFGFVCYHADNEQHVAYYVRYNKEP